MHSETSTPPSIHVADKLTLSGQYYTCVSFQSLRELERKAHLYDLLSHIFSYKKFHWESKIVRCLLAVEFCMAPTVLFLAYQRLLTTIIGSVFSLTNIPAEDIVANTPSTTSIKNLLHETAAEILVLIQKKAKGSKIYFACNTANKKKVHHMIKYITFFILKEWN